jgi:hypothetical protein
MVKSPQVIRILFLVLILLIPIEIVVKRVAGAEPYPALFLPNFGSILETDSSVHYEEPEIIAVLADGQQVVLDPAKVMPGSGNGYSVVFENSVTNTEKVNSADSKQWLSEQLAASYPGLDIKSVFINWRQWEYNSNTGDAAISSIKQSYEIVLDGSK